MAQVNFCDDCGKRIKPDEPQAGLQLTAGVYDPNPENPNGVAPLMALDERRMYHASCGEDIFNALRIELTPTDPVEL